MGPCIEEQKYLGHADFEKDLLAQNHMNRESSIALRRLDILCEGFATMDANPTKKRRRTTEPAGGGRVQLGPTAPEAGAAPTKPVAVPAAVVLLLPTVRTHIEETGEGGRFDAPFTHAVLREMVQMLVRAGEGV